jgi:RND family efflux transporter MFP subunit
MNRSSLTLIVLPLVALNAWQFWMAHASTGTPAPLQAHGATPHKAASDTPRSGRDSIKSVVVHAAPINTSLKLTGQAALTETGRADVTAPLSGTLATLQVKLGSQVKVGDPIAVINSAFGQTPLQLMQKLEQDQAALLQAQNSLEQARSSVHQGETGLAQARTALSQAQDAVLQAQAEMTNAGTDFRRKKSLFEAGVFAKAEVDDARERYEKAQAVLDDTKRVVVIARQGVRIAAHNLDPLRSNIKVLSQAAHLAQVNLERDRAIYAHSQVAGATIATDLTPQRVASSSSASAASSPTFVVRAPVAGQVSSISSSLGLTVQAGAILASIADTRRIYVDINAYDLDVSRVAPGDPVSVTTAALAGKAFGGTVSSVGATVDPVTRTITVRSVIDNPHQLLRSGMFVAVAVTPKRPRVGIVVPAEAVLYDGDSKYVIVESADHKTQRRTIREGQRTRDRVEVLEGLRDGERVVTHGNLLVVPE